MAPARAERNRVLGIRIGPGLRTWVGDTENRVLGFPVDWFRRYRPAPAPDRPGDGEPGDGEPGDGPEGH